MNPHNRMVDGWCDMLRELRLTFHKEPRNRYANNENRPDIVLYDTDDGVSSDLDISIDHPCSSDMVKKSAKERGAAAKKREDIKSAKYAEQQIPGIGSPRIIPIVYEQIGLWRSKATNYLKMLSKRSKQDPTIKEREFRDFWRKS